MAVNKNIYPRKTHKMCLRSSITEYRTFPKYLWVNVNYLLDKYKPREMIYTRIR